MLEPGLEALLLRIVPNLAREWSGASPEDLEELEEQVELTGHDFPPFYRWFLSRLAGSVGALHPMLQGFTAASVLEAYRTGSVDIGPTQFLIGRMPDALRALERGCSGIEERLQILAPMQGNHSVRRRAIDVVETLKALKWAQTAPAVPVLAWASARWGPECCVGIRAQPGVPFVGSVKLGVRSSLPELAGSVNERPCA